MHPFLRSGAASLTCVEDRQQCGTRTGTRMRGLAALPLEVSSHVLSLGLDGLILTLVSQAFLSLVATRHL